MVSKKLPEHEIGSGNVFADIGVPGAREHLVKTQMVGEIHKIMKDRKLTQREAAKLMGITQPEVSRMLRGHFREYSVHRLIQFLTVFDRDVEIVIRRHKKRGKRGEIRVQAT